MVVHAEDDSRLRQLKGSDAQVQIQRGYRLAGTLNPDPARMHALAGIAAGDLCQCIAGDQHCLGRRPRGKILIRGRARCLSQMIDLHIESGFDFDLDVV